MTNAELYLQEAVEKLDRGVLGSWESDFVSQFRYYTKKDLRNLTSKQFLRLREIAKRKYAGEV